MVQNQNTAIPEEGVPGAQTVVNLKIFCTWLWMEKQRRIRKNSLNADECLPCLDQYNLEKSILEMIKSKLEKKSCPEELLQEIKLQIAETND